MSDDTKRGSRAKSASLKIRTTGHFRSIKSSWGVNFGPDSDVDALIPGSGGHTLRKLREAGEIPADCFDAVDAADASREG